VRRDIATPVRHGLGQFSSESTPDPEDASPRLIDIAASELTLANKVECPFLDPTPKGLEEVER